MDTRDSQNGNLFFWEEHRISLVYVYIYIYIYDPAFRPRGPPPNGMGPQVAPPLPFSLQAIGSISEIQPRIC